MANVTTNKQDAHKLDYHALIKNDSNNFARKSDNNVIIKSNDEIYKPLTKRDYVIERVYNSDFRDTIKRIMILLCFGSIMIFPSFALLSMISNSFNTIMSNYNLKIQFGIDINNNTIKETRYQHILVDTPDIHIEEEKYDYEIVPLNKDESSTEYPAFHNTEVRYKTLQKYRYNV